MRLYYIYIDSNKAPTLPVEALLLPLRMPLFCSFEIIALVGCGISGAPFCGSGRPPGRGSVSCVLLDALQQLGLALHFSLDLPQCFKDIVQNEFFHDGGASLYFHYDIINPQPEQRLLRRRLYPVFPDKNPYYAEQDCK